MFAYVAKLWQPREQLFTYFSVDVLLMKENDNKLLSYVFNLFILFWYVCEIIRIFVK